MLLAPRGSFVFVVRIAGGAMHSGSVRRSMRNFSVIVVFFAVNAKSKEKGG